MKQEKNINQSILMTAYAVNPYKGSEDGMGWNFIMQAATTQRVIAITRKNNRPHIEKYMAEHPDGKAQYQQVQWWYFDWPKWMIFWKKGPLLSLIYYYMWQLSLAIWLLPKRSAFSIVHTLNFHNDWTPSFLWLMGKPFVWGPIGHHPRIPASFIRKQYGWRAWLQDRFLWAIKNWFWYIDPFVYISKWKARHIFCMNTEAAIKLRLPRHKYSIMPSVASEPVRPTVKTAIPDKFTVLSVGRFVPLKGFDVTIAAFATFYFQLSRAQQEKTQLILAGAGPFLPKIKQWIAEANITHCTQVIEWMPKAELEKMYRQSAVFLFPSHEGAGMVVAEAMSYGLPVICFNNAGPGAFVHPDSLLKVSYKNHGTTVQSFAAKLQMLHSNTGTYLHEHQLAEQRFNQYFLWSVRGKQLATVYNTLLHKRTPVDTKQKLHMA
ncbi:MAG: glycosyltransferase [Chitinophagaceae bacterium]|nr:glycosyltransferase [Chitinophagaceae bacterium]